MNSLEQAEFLLKLEKAKAYTRLGAKQEAEVEYIEALEIATEIARREEFKDAIRLLERLMKRLEEGPFLESAWAETYMIIAICYARLNDEGAKKRYFDKVRELEPENPDLKEIAVKNGYIWK